MPGTGFVARFLKPCAAAAFMTVLDACGGGGAPPAPEVVRITVAGMPGAPLAPMQKAQLTASAVYSDGAVQDVTSAAGWDSTDRNVFTASLAGLVTATGPGKADVSAVFAGVRGTVREKSLPCRPPTSATASSMRSTISSMLKVEWTTIGFPSAKGSAIRMRQLTIRT